MKNSRLINILAVKLELSISETEELLKLILGILSDQLSDNIDVTIEDFGVLSTIKQNEFISDNVETGERYLMPPELLINFEPSSEVSSVFDSELIENFDILFEPDELLKKRVNSAFQHFEPTLINKGVDFPGINVVSIGELAVESEDMSEFESTELEPELEPELKPVLEPEFESAELESESIELEPTEHEHKTEVKVCFVSYSEPDNNTNVKSPPPKKLDPDSGAKTEKKRKLSSIWVPVIGGVAIAVAALFFFNTRSYK